MPVTSASPDIMVEALRREFIPFLREELRFYEFCKKGSIQRNVGSKAIRWFKFAKITTDSTSSLQETSTTAGEITGLSITTITSTVAEYGAWSKISSLAEIASTPETLASYGEGYGEHGARTLDILLRNEADDTTTFLISGETAKNTGTLATTETATAQDIAVISGIFHINDAKEVTRDGMYVVIVHGEVEQDLVTDVTTTRLSWSEVNKHVPGMDGQEKIIKGSPGAVYGTMVLRSNIITTATLTSSVTAYKNIALADYGVGCTSFEGMTPSGAGPVGPRIIMKHSGPQDTSNPLSMFYTVGWKLVHAQEMLDNDRVIVYYSAK